MIYLSKGGGAVPIRTIRGSAPAISPSRSSINVTSDRLLFESLFKQTKHYRCHYFNVIYGRTKQETEFADDVLYQVMFDDYVKSYKVLKL